MHNKVKKSRALTIYGYPQTTSNSVRVLSPPLDRPALRAPITLTAYAQGEHHFISSTQNHHRNHQIPAPDPFVPKLSVHSPTGPGSRRSCQTCRWLSPWPTSSSSLSPPSLNTPQPALAPAGLVRLAGDHQACVQHLLHHFNPHQAPPHDDQNQGQVEPPPPPPAGQAHREEALLVKVKRGNFREGQKCNHTFLRSIY